MKNVSAIIRQNFVLVFSNSSIESGGVAFYVPPYAFTRVWYTCARNVYVLCRVYVARGKAWSEPNKEISNVIKTMIV